MKTILAVLMITLIAISSCKDDKSKLRKDNHATKIGEQLKDSATMSKSFLDSIVAKLEAFSPITNSIEKDLENYALCSSVQYIYERLDTTELDVLTNNLMLKLLHQNLSTANQSYGLNPMLEGCAGPIVSYFLSRYNLQREEFMTSNAVHYLINRNILKMNFDPNLLDEIIEEKKRINNASSQ